MLSKALIHGNCASSFDCFQVRSHTIRYPETLCILAVRVQTCQWVAQVSSADLKASALRERVEEKRKSIIPGCVDGVHSLSPGSRLGCMDGIASVRHQHDFISRHTTMYLLLTMDCFMTHTALALTPEQSATRGEVPT